jgi:GH35 family endo-1,4-beta-xylanase
MKKRVWVFVFLLTAASACKKDSGSGGTTPPPPTPPVVETAPLKSVATFPIAVAGGYGAFMTNATSSAILKRDFNGMTFENEMKNSSIVNNSGGYNFSTADAMVAAAQAADIKIHGHVLAWHSQVQGAYYRSQLNAAAGPAYNYAKVDSLLKTTIQTIAGHFKGKVRGWDVINEMFSDGPAGTIRNNSNTANATADNVFVWSEYLGRDFGVKAFTYAAEADPDAKLFINDYNLEYSTAKLDSLIAYVAEIRGRGARVDGIGTQMHVNINTNKDAIDNHFKKLAATGLLVHVSELDIGVNTNNAASIVFTDALETTQAEMYNYIVTSYMRNVPKPQRYGVTIWGLLDNQSWRYKNGADYPLIYNAAGGKKKAYEAVLNALKSGL